MQAAPLSAPDVGAQPSWTYLGSPEVPSAFFFTGFFFAAFFGAAFFTTFFTTFFAMARSVRRCFNTA